MIIVCCVQLTSPLHRQTKGQNRAKLFEMVILKIVP